MDVEKFINLRLNYFVNLSILFIKGMAPDLRYIESVSRTIAKYSDGSKIVVEKSTVPVKSAQSILHILKEAQVHNKKLSFQVLLFNI